MSYSPDAPSREDVDQLRGPAVVEFGNDWCGHCRRAQPLIEEAFADHPRVRRIKVADGSGRPLGRSFQVKLWPTMIFLRDGQEEARLVRPQDAESIRDALEQIDTAP